MNELELMRIIDGPLVSEKSTVASERHHQVVFKVRRSASKQAIKRAVEKMFEVQVDAVRVLNVRGKRKRFGRYLGKRSDWKKAYVRLVEGQDIDFGGD